MNHAPKKPFVSDKLAKRRKAASRARKIIAATILIVVVGVASYFTYAQRFAIRDVEVRGAAAVPADEIAASTNEKITGLRFIIPKRNIFLYSRSGLRKELAEAFPRLATVAVEVENKNLIVTVTERQPAYLWCGEHLPATRQESFEDACYFVDAKGFIFSLAPQFSDAVYPKIYTTLDADLANESGEVAPLQPIGKQAMAPEVLANVAILAKQVTTSTFKPSAFSVTADGDAIIFLFRDSDNLPEIRYNPAHDPLIVAAGFKTAIATEPLKSKLASFSTLQYIDLRFANKVFYKFSDQQEASSNKETNEQQ